MSGAPNNERWLSEHSEELGSLLAVGALSYSRIAGAINEKFGTSYSRNACIGRAGRMGLCQTKTAPAPRRAPPPKLGAASVRKAKPRFVQIPAEQIEIRCAEIEPRNLSLVDLGQSDCRYPVTHDSPFLFCGHLKIEGESYCGPHLALSRKVDHRGRGRPNENFTSILRRKNIPAVMVLAEDGVS
jgi:GcrA cell cycle regulator